MIRLYIVFFLISSYCYSQNPWQQQKGEILISPYFGNYNTNQFRNSNGDKSEFGNNGMYKNYNPKIYFSIPLNDYKLNLFGNIPYFISKYDDDSVSQKSTEFGDIELGLRMHLKKINNHYLMASASVYIPAYQNKTQPFVGYNLYSTEVKIHYAGNFTWLDVNKNFHKIEAGIRYFFPSLPIQYKLYASQGYRVFPKIIVLGELDLLLSRSDNKSFSVNNVQFASNFDMIKTSINIGYDFTNSISIYGGLFHDVFNRNISVGKGFQVFGIIKL